MGNRKVVAVTSGKGGVGKSTVSVNLAVALAEAGAAVGLLDADIYGPDIPRMFGLTRHVDAKHLTVWESRADMSALEPMERFGVKLMSTQFLIGERQAVSTESGFVRLLLDRLFRSTAWGELDFLFVDLPPGTGDVQQQLTNELGVDGALVVVTPQDVAHLDAKKVLTMLGQSRVPVVGGVENMGPIRCPCCGADIELFPPVAEPRSIWALGVPCIARLPFTPAVGLAGDEGRPVLATEPDGAAAAAFRDLADRVATAVSGK